MSQRLNLGQRLLLINATLVVLLLAVAATVWVMMGRVVDAAERINETNVPQLQIIAELELNVTRTSLQVRHAILSRNPQELDATLADIGEKKRLLLDALKVFGEGMIDDAGRQAFAPLPALMTEFWRIGEANVKLIQEGKKDEAFAYLVDHTIPARNALLKPLAQEKKRQGERLAYRIDEIESLSKLDRNIVVVSVVVVALGPGWRSTCARWCAPSAPTPMNSSASPTRWRLATSACPCGCARATRTAPWPSCAP